MGAASRPGHSAGEGKAVVGFLHRVAVSFNVSYRTLGPVSQLLSLIRWLNRITGEEFHFFGIQIELWQIESSPLAPRFSVVAKPNNWTKLARSIGRTGLSSEDVRQRSEAYREWWGQLMSFLREKKAVFGLASSSPPSGHWVTLRTEAPRSLTVTVSRSQKDSWTKLYVLFRDAEGRKTDQAARWFEFARRHRDEVESVVSHEISWHEDADAGYCALGVSDQGEVEQSFAWLNSIVPPLTESLGKMYRRFERVAAELPNN